MPDLVLSPYLLLAGDFALSFPVADGVHLRPKAGFLTVVNLIGRCNMDFGRDNPFLMADATQAGVQTRLNFLDFHAEATSEKLGNGLLSRRPR